MAITTAQQTQILKITAGLFNAAPGATYLTDFAAFVTANGGTPAAMLALSNALAGSSVFTTSIMGGSVTTAAQVQKLMTNFGLVYAATPTAGTAAGDAQTWFTAQINAGRGFGQIIYDATTALSDAVWLALPANAIYASVATTLSNKAAVADYYSSSLTASGITGLATSSTSLTALQAVVSSVTSTTLVATAADLAAAIAAGGGTTGTTFTLTTGADTLTGTSGNDTFIALVDATTPANATLSASDTINGGAGTADTLNITTQAAGAVADALNSALVSNIETINLRAVGTGGVTFAAGGASGLTALNNNLSTDAVTITGLASTTALKITGNGTVVNGATTATYAASATTGAVTLDGGLTAGAVAVNGAGFTSFTVNSTGATNTIGAISSSGTSIAATTINAATAFLTTGLTVGTVAAGGQTLTISGAAGDRAANATNAARSAVTLGALDADFETITASGLTAGGVSATLSATVAATFTGGAGSDRITTSTSAQTGSIDAGLGTDTLILTASAHIDTTAEGAIYKNFEVLHSNDAAAAVAIDMDLITGSTITSIMITDAANGTSITDMSATQAAAVTVAAGAGAMTLGVKGSTTVGTLNTLTITVSDGDTTGSEAVWGTGDLTLAGVETVNIIATDDVTWATMANITGLTSLVVTGAGDVSITTGAHVVTANESVNFSGLTADSTFNFAAATTNALAFTGGSGVDTVTDSVVGGNVINTGAGRDVVTLTLKTSGSADQITLGAGGDSLAINLAYGNAADDQLTLKYAAGDSVSDSTVATTGFLAAKMDAVTGIDLATVAGAGTGNVITFDTVESATAVTFSATGITFGTTAVTNAFDFYVYNTGAGGISYVYQDTNGNSKIDTGEFAVQLTGVAATASTTGEFTVSSGNLVLTTVAG